MFSSIVNVQSPMSIIGCAKYMFNSKRVSNVEYDITPSRVFNSRTGIDGQTEKEVYRLTDFSVGRKQNGTNNFHFRKQAHGVQYGYQIYNNTHTYYSP